MASNGVDQIIVAGRHRRQAHVIECYVVVPPDRILQAPRPEEPRNHAARSSLREAAQHVLRAVPKALKVLPLLAQVDFARIEP